MSEHFKKRVALIYGAGNGIGRAVAQEFARRGARLGVADIDLDGAKQTASLIAEAGGEAIALSCDVTQTESVRAAADEAEARLGPADIVMNNVGVILSGNPEDIPLHEWERIINLNLMSTVRGIDVFLPKMIARGGGHIINTASFAGLFPYAANRLPYAASKAAVISLSQNLAIYLQPMGVRVSCFCPGPVLTGVMGAMKTWSKNVAMRGVGRQYRLMQPDEAATILADGVENGRVLIPTHEEVLGDLQRWAASPDGFIQAKIDAFAAGDDGRPGTAP